MEKFTLITLNMGGKSQIISYARELPVVLRQYVQNLSGENLRVIKPGELKLALEVRSAVSNVPADDLRYILFEKLGAEFGLGIPRPSVEKLLKKLPDSELYQAKTLLLFIVPPGVEISNVGFEELGRIAGVLFLEDGRDFYQYRMPKVVLEKLSF